MAWKLIKKSWLDISYIPLLITAVIASGVLFVIFTRTQVILKERLQERMVTAIGLASLRINADDVEKVRSAEDLNSDALKNVIGAMRGIRQNIKDAKYVYILRPTDKPTSTKFVADADMIEPVDWDGNGTIDEVEIPPLPGDDYDISDNPAARLAIASPTAAQEPYTDKWGTLFSAYAPIRNQAGEAIAVIGVDVQYDQYSALIQAMRTPLLILGALFLGLLTMQAVAMIGIWRRRVRILAEVDEAKNATINIVAHQMGAVSTRFRWYAEMLKDGDTSKEECAEQVESGNAELRNITSLFLDAAHVYMKKFTVSPAPLDLNVFLKRLTDAASLGASQKKIHYTASVPSKLPTVLLDESRTYFSIENLLNNAIKYTPEGGNVDFTVTDKDGMLRISVKDTGMGIPKQDKDKMFSQMYRASNVKNIDGNGLGLYIAKEAIELQGGKIWYESEGIPGKGTTFFVNLPLKPAPEQKPEKKK